jgi:hypothetical protein
MHRSIKIPSIVFLTCMTAINGSHASTLLFQDTFDRPDSDDIDAASGGMSGSLAPLAYNEVREGSGAPTSIAVVSSTLALAVGPGASDVFLEHNFTDASILSDGGFRVSLDVLQFNSTTDQVDRYIAFGIGMSEAEALSLQDGNDAGQPTLRSASPLSGSGATVVSDFSLDLSQDGKVRVWLNGNIATGSGPAQTFDVNGGSNFASGATINGTIAAEFFFSDFNAGSTVNYKVFYNGSELGTGSFNWSGTEENYIALAGRDASGAFADNLVITTLPEPSSAYNAWASTNAPTGDPDDDFDGDGVSNAVEFVLGGDKDTNDLDKLPVTSTSGGDMLFTFERDQASIDASTTLEIETSTDLVTWDTSPSPYTVPDAAVANNPGVTVVKDSSAGFDTVTLQVPQSPDAKKFARLKVAISP